MSVVKTLWFLKTAYVCKCLLMEGGLMVNLVWRFPRSIYSQQLIFSMLLYWFTYYAVLRDGTLFFILFLSSNILLVDFQFLFMIDICSQTLNGFFIYFVVTFFSLSLSTCAFMWLCMCMSVCFVICA